MVGKYCDRNGIVGVDDFFVGVFGGDCEVEFCCQVGGVIGSIGGEIELGYLQGGDREFGALGVVEDVEAGAANGGQEEDCDEEEDGPEEGEAAASAAGEATAVVAVARSGSGAVGVVVEVGFGCRRGFEWWICYGGCGGGGGIAFPIWLA